MGNVLGRAPRFCRVRYHAPRDTGSPFDLHAGWHCAPRSRSQRGGPLRQRPCRIRRARSSESQLPNPKSRVLRPILYLGCPAPERAETEGALSTAGLSIVWADSPEVALGELRRREIPVLVDLSSGAAALEAARELRMERAPLIFAVVDSRRPDLTTEAVLAGMADVFARPLSGRRVASAIDRELAAAGGNGGRAVDITTDDLYHHSPAMRDVMPVIARAASMRAGVIVRGEDGTGRQVVARAIHAARADAGV